MTRSQRCTVSPSLALYEPAARMGGVSPSLGSQTHPPPGHFRPLSPSLELAELLPSPRASPCNSPSLGLIPAAAMARPHPPPVILRGHASKARMTTAVCKRASRMARPSDPSTDTAAEAQRIVVLHEHSLREQGRERVIGEVTPQPFKLSVASTGKGPAVRVDTGDAAADAAAQAMMNHVRSFHATPLYTALRTCLLACRAHRWSRSSLATSSPARTSPPGCSTSSPPAPRCTGAWPPMPSRGVCPSPSTPLQDTYSHACHRPQQRGQLVGHQAREDAGRG